MTMQVCLWLSTATLLKGVHDQTQIHHYGSCKGQLRSIPQPASHSKSVPNIIWWPGGTFRLCMYTPGLRILQLWNLCVHPRLHTLQFLTLCVYTSPAELSYTGSRPLSSHFWIPDSGLYLSPDSLDFIVIVSLYYRNRVCGYIYTNILVSNKEVASWMLALLISHAVNLTN